MENTLSAGPGVDDAASAAGHAVTGDGDEEIRIIQGARRDKKRGHLEFNIIWEAPHHSPSIADHRLGCLGGRVCAMSHTTQW